jgi:NAD(P)-dependent dehydrogenase (short-subunit alcohol dehydrogenase family)
MAHVSERVVLVTGASAGIGAACVQRLVRAGARVAMAARRADRLAALQRDVDPSGARTLILPGDITDAADRARWIVNVVEHFGGLDVLVNNAGYGQRGPLECVPLADVRRNYETNVFALLGLTQLALPHLRARRGRVVNIGSVAGRIARPLTAVYDSTKHALEALSDGLRGELAPFGVHVALVRPGFIATEFIDAADRESRAALAETGPYAPYLGDFGRTSTRLRRWAGQPDDIARLVEHAVYARYPKTHYAAPRHAQLLLFLRWLLPVRAWDRLVRLRAAPSAPANSAGSA